VRKYETYIENIIQSPNSKDTIQWPKEKGQKDKQWLKNATQKTFRNTNPTKNRDALSIHIVSKWTLPNIDLSIVVH
jgi:hypothetical protein